jgi:hypothetical protein
MQPADAAQSGRQISIVVKGGWQCIPAASHLLVRAGPMWYACGMISRDDGRPRDPLVRQDKFPLGQMAMTPGVQAEIPPSEMMQALRRHARCDWGDICEEDRGQNEWALANGARLVSVYHSKAGVKFFVITEADRSLTTVLLPAEY